MNEPRESSVSGKSCAYRALYTAHARQWRRRDERLSIRRWKPLLERIRRYKICMLTHRSWTIYLFYQADPESNDLCCSFMKTVLASVQSYTHSLLPTQDHREPPISKLSRCLKHNDTQISVRIFKSTRRYGYVPLWSFCRRD